MTRHAAKVRPPLRRPLFKDLLVRHSGQLALREEAKLGTLVAVLTAGTLPEPAQGVEQWWANELHPTPAGFRRLARERFMPEIGKL